MVVKAAARGGRLLPELPQPCAPTRNAKSHRLAVFLTVPRSDNLDSVRVS